MMQLPAGEMASLAGLEDGMRKRETIRASNAGHPCIRWHVANTVAGELRPELAGLAETFAIGHVYGQHVAPRILTGMGWLIMATEVPVYGVCTGHADFLAIKGDELAIVEAKSTQAFNKLAAGPKSDEGSSYMRRYPAQLEIYHRQHPAHPAAYWLAMEVGGAHRRALIPYQPSDALWEAIQARCVAVAEWSAKVPTGVEALQGPLREVPSMECTEWCQGCEWRTMAGCVVVAKDVPALADDALRAMLAERAELAEYAARYQEVDAAVKGRIKAALPDGGEATVDGWSVRVKRTERAGYTVKPSVVLSIDIRGDE